MPQVTLRSEYDWQKGSLEVRVDSSRDEAEVVAFVPFFSYDLQRVTLDGDPVTPDWVCESEALLPVVKVGRGRHTLRLSFGPLARARPAPVAEFGLIQDQAGVAINLPGFDRALVTVERDGRVLMTRTIAREADALKLPVSPVRPEAGTYTVSLRAVAEANGDLRPVAEMRASLELAAAMPDLGLSPERASLAPGTRVIEPVNRTINGLAILNTATATTAIVPGEIQPGLESLTAEARPDELTIEAGTTRAILQGQRDIAGAAFAGLEISDLRRVQVRLTNTYHGAFHMRGPGIHVPNRPSSRNFAGIVVDYHTSEGYTKRLRLATGVLHPECSSTHPDYGRAALADETRDLGSALIEVPETTFALDLQPYAPEDWDGQVWLSVGSDWVCPSRMLKLEILAANEAVSGEFISGTDPRAFREAYAQPRVLEVPRSPGGIVIDGLPFEEWWRGAAKTDQFFLYGGEGISEARTTAMLMYDDTSLYVAFTCHEPDRRKPLIVGGPAWDDDEVEVWMDMNGDAETFRQVILNAVNDKLEYGETGPTVIGATSAVHSVEGAPWMVEMQIPFAGLGVEPPKPGDTWRLSLCRGRPPTKNSPTFELIVWASLKQGGFKDLANFGTLIFR